MEPKLMQLKIGSCCSVLVAVAVCKWEGQAKQHCAFPALLSLLLSLEFGPEPRRISGILGGGGGNGVGRCLMRLCPELGDSRTFKALYQYVPIRACSAWAWPLASWFGRLFCLAVAFLSGSPLLSLVFSMGQFRHLGQREVGFLLPLPPLGELFLGLWMLIILLQLPNFVVCFALLFWSFSWGC